MKFGDGLLAMPLGRVTIGGTKYPVAKVSNATTLAAPIGGINARDSIANMDPTDAIELINFFPSTLGCQVRKGNAIHSYGYPAAVQTLANHQLATNASYLYAFSGGNMYDATPGGAVGAAMLSGLSNDQWQWVDFPTTGGVYWLGVNGADNPILVDPSKAVHRLVAGNGTDAYTIANVDPKTFTSVTVHQKRLWFTALNTTICYYLPPAQMWGAASMNDFGPLFKKGGNSLVQLAWTVDAGDGPDDRLVTISSAGEVAVYSGTDPSSLATWGLNGVFFIGRPIGIRCATKFGGDVAVLCDQGLASLNAVLTSTTVNTRTSFFSDKIQNLISNEIFSWSDYFGWQPFVYPQQNMLILNVPDGNYPDGLQIVMNTITGAWTKFEGMQALNWVNRLKDIYYGASDKTVRQGLSGFMDNFDTYHGVVGTDIDCICLTAFNYFSNPGAEKNYTLVRPNFLGINKPSLSVQANMQFDTGLPPDPPPAINTDSPFWDTAHWDVNLWTGDNRSFNDWYGVLGIGYAASLALKLKAKDQISWASTDWVFQIQQGTAL